MAEINKLMKLATTNKAFQKELIKISKSGLSGDALNEAVAAAAKRCGVTVKAEELNTEYKNPYYGKKINLDQIDD